MLLLRGRNNWQCYLGESTENRPLGAKGTEEHIPKKSSFSPVIKVPKQNKCQEPLFRIIITYFRQYAFAFPGKEFPRGRNNRKKTLEEAKVLGANIPLQNNCISM